MPELRIVQPGGSEDYAKAIQDALDAVAKAGGGEVVLPPGDYPYRGKLVVRDGTVLRGSGGTRLLPQDPMDGAIRLTGKWVTIRELTLQGRADKRTGKGDATGIRPLDAEHVEIDRMRVTGTAAAGIFVQKTAHFRITNCTVHDCLADGIHITAGSSHGQIIGNQSRGNEDDLIALVGYEKDGRQVEHVVIQGNMCRDGNARGISCLGARYVTVSGNMIHGTGAAGIYVHQEDNYKTYGVSDLTIVGNVMRDVSRRVSHAGLFIGGGDGDRPTADGAKVSNGVYRVMLSDNILDGSSDAGAFVSDHARDVSGCGNLIRNAKRTGVRIEGKRENLTIRQVDS
ncbi:MAG TPA: right-handed parallel beta-helix repeat-containing protein [Azospirillaceae bacterium]|nr:right-handed parallel beta-helix repeat-containing protein [Azospirillaceae bacterium]